MGQRKSLVGPERCRFAVIHYVDEAIVLGSVPACFGELAVPVNYIAGRGRTHVNVLPRPTKLSSSDVPVALSGTYTKSIGGDGDCQCSQRTHWVSSPAGMLLLPGVDTHGAYVHVPDLLPPLDLSVPSTPSVVTIAPESVQSPVSCCALGVAFSQALSTLAGTAVANVAAGGAGCSEDVDERCADGVDGWWPVWLHPTSNTATAGAAAHVATSLIITRSFLIGPTTLKRCCRTGFGQPTRDRHH